MKKLIIRNSEWYRGKGGAGSSLSVDNKHCCLGILARDLGISEEEMYGCAYPNHLEREILKEYEYPEEILDEQRIIGGINDDIKTTSEGKIRLLKPYFEKAGIEIEFRRNE